MITLALFLALADPAPSNDLADAKVDFDKGTQHYNLGEFGDALVDYKEAYRKSKLPAFLFNIGQCYFALGDFEKAAFFYEGFLRESPNSDHKAEVEADLAEARRLAAEQKNKAPATTEPLKPAPVVTTPPPPAPQPSTPPPSTTATDEDNPWLVPSIIAGGVVIVGTAVVVATVALWPAPKGTLPTIDLRSGS